ncbi:hypothetical protein ACGFYF_41630 [Streptomyces lavendulae]
MGKCDPWEPVLPSAMPVVPRAQRARAEAKAQGDMPSSDETS